MASARNGTLYTGVTNDISRRAHEHKSGLLPGFTRRYRVTRLVFMEEYDRIDEARTREAALKKWRRAWKIALIEAVNPDWDDLAEKLA